MRIIQEKRPLAVSSRWPGAQMEWSGDRRKSVSGLLSASASWVPRCLWLCPTLPSPQLCPSVPSVPWNCEPKQPLPFVLCGWIFTTVTRKSAYTRSLTTEPSLCRITHLESMSICLWPRKGVETHKWVLRFCGASQGAFFLVSLKFSRRRLIIISF